MWIVTRIAPEYASVSLLSSNSTGADVTVDGSSSSMATACFRCGDYFKLETVQ
jgi:hypothetical protein